MVDIPNKLKVDLLELASKTGSLEFTDEIDGDEEYVRCRGSFVISL